MMGFGGSSSVKIFGFTTSDLVSFVAEQYGIGPRKQQTNI
jgi:hypothetical protein